MINGDSKKTLVIGSNKKHKYKKKKTLHENNER